MLVSKRSWVENSISWAVKVTIFTIIISLFLQNFLFSRDFGLLVFREIDDIAFQSTIRKAHLHIINGDFINLLTINDYAYGLIYWLFVSLVTFPFFILSEYFEIHWPLIVFPRQLSLFFAIMSAVVIKKIATNFGASNRYSNSLVLVFFLFPLTGYYSMRFGTVNFILLFSSLAVFFASKSAKLTVYHVLMSIISLSIATAIKLTGILIAPFVLYLLVSRIDTQFVKDNSKIALICIGLIPLFFVLMAAPQLFVVIFNFGMYENYLARFLDFIASTQSSPIKTSAVEMLYTGIIGSHGIAIFVCFSMFGIAIAIWNRYENWLDYFFIFISVGVATLFLGVTSNSSVAISSYITNVFFLLVFALIPLKHIPAFSTFPLIAVCILFLDAINTNVKAHENSEMFARVHLSYIIKMAHSSKLIEDAQTINECFQSEKIVTTSEHILIDHTAPIFLNSRSAPNICISVVWGNLSPRRVYCQKSIDYMILDKRITNQFITNNFNKNSEDLTDSALVASQSDWKNRQILFNQGKFGGEKFVALCESKFVSVFRNEQLVKASIY